jgi:hypothetical protein
MNVADAFDAWWADSFPMAPANRQARENYVAFGLWLLEQQQPACPHIASSEEGTSYCRLAEYGHD